MKNVFFIINSLKACIIWVTKRGAFWYKQHHRVKWKNRIHCHYNGSLRIWNVIYIIFSTHLNIFVMSLSVSRDFKTLQINPRKPQIWSKINKINVGFCDNAINRSLVSILKYIVCGKTDKLIKKLYKWNKADFKWVAPLLSFCFFWKLLNDVI